MNGLEFAKRSENIRRAGQVPHRSRQNPLPNNGNLFLERFYCAPKYGTFFFVKYWPSTLSHVPVFYGSDHGARRSIHLKLRGWVWKGGHNSPKLLKVTQIAPKSSICRCLDHLHLSDAPHILSACLSREYYKLQQFRRHPTTLALPNRWFCACRYFCYLSLLCRYFLPKVTTKGQK